MAPMYDMVSAITAKHDNWSLLVRVVRKWKVSDFATNTKTFSLEMVLMDSEGNKIHASVRKQLIYKFDNELKEGSVYNISKFGVAANLGEYRSTRHQFKLNFTFHTKIPQAIAEAIPVNVFNFTPPADCFKDNFESDFLIDIIGVLKGLGKEREYEKNGVKSKLLQIELDNDGYRFKFTLFGTFVDQLNSFVSSGEAINAVVVILFAKLKTWQGQKTLQNTINASQLLFNPDIPEAASLRKRMTDTLESPNQGLSQLQDTSRSRISIEDDLLNLTTRTNIQTLKDCKEEATFVVKGTVSCLADGEGWWYSACTCNKKVYPDSDMYYCEKCDRHVLNVIPRYLLKLRVIDDTESATFVVFDRDASILLQKSCAELLESINMSHDKLTIPKEICDLIGKTFLFKVCCDGMTDTRYERSYRVKRFSEDFELLKKFDEGLHNVGLDSEVGFHNVVLSANTSSDFAQDLMTKFSQSSFDPAKEDKVPSVVDLCNDSPESSAVKRPYPFGAESASTKVVMKQIKIEKD